MRVSASASHGILARRKQIVLFADCSAILSPFTHLIRIIRKNANTCVNIAVTHHPEIFVSLETELATTC